MGEFKAIIARDDIRPGDIIKVTSSGGGVLVTRTGTVAPGQISHGVFRTAEGSVLWDGGWAGKYVFELLDRPKPKLPQGAGAVILATHVEGYMSAYIHLALRYDGKWVALVTGEEFSRSAIKEWKPAKVVEVE
jgi:anaerobic selenocysteine-containing dehydrogenase